MNLFEPGQQRVSLIPWVVVLAVLIGWNALGGDALRGKRDEASRAVVLSESSEDGQIAGRAVDLPDFEAVVMGDGWDVDFVWACIGIEQGHDVGELDFPHGVGFGRAPPFGDC